MTANEIKDFAAQRLADVAAFNGCFGKEDGVCIELRPDDPVEWCKYCVQGVAAKLLRAGHAPASETPPTQLMEEIDAWLSVIVNTREGMVVSEAAGLLKRAYAALKSPRPASETGQASAWQPMESAPHEGKHVLVWLPSIKCVALVARQSGTDTWHHVYSDLDLVGTPTRWMLPLAPSEDETTTK